MSLVLEIPSTEIDSYTPVATPDESTAAKAAVDLLDQPDNDPAFDTNEADGGMADDPTVAEQNGQPAEQLEKKKRGRKKKQEEAEKTGTDQPAGMQERGSPPAESQDARPVDAPDSTTPPVASVPPMSRSTRGFQIATFEREAIELLLEQHETEAEIERHKERLKEIKERQAEISRELITLRTSETYQPPLPFDCKSIKDERDHPAATEAVTVPSVTPPVPVDFYPDSWRSASINELGLPDKLVEKLALDGIELIGQLEDRRGEISQGRAKWPKGIGAARITEIENAIVEWLSKDRDQAVLAECGRANPTEPPEAPTCPAESERASPVIDAANVPTAGQWEAMSDDEQRDYIARRADLINDGSNSCLDSKHPETDRHWSQGFQDFDADVGGGRKCELQDCIYTPGPEMDDWIRGWLAAGVCEKYEPSEGKQTDSPAVNLGLSVDDI